MLIRGEQDKDRDSIFRVNAAAFETSAEANLVNVLREEGGSFVSLVAEDNAIIVGHIMFSPVSLINHPRHKLMGLGPMAVVPEFQRTGIGAALVKAGLTECERLGVGAVVVLGHPDYYPRFGFKPAIQSGIRCEFHVPEDVFMVVELQPGFLAGTAGMVKYHPSFGKV
jgi:putative acetyltransferase